MDKELEARLDADPFFDRPPTNANKPEHAPAPSVKPGQTKTMEELAAEWDDEIPTNTDNAGTNTDKPGQYVDEWGWDAPLPEHTSTNSSRVATNTDKGRQTRTRGPRLRFGEPTIELMRRLRRAGYSITEITDYMRKQPGYEAVSQDVVRSRIVRGPSVVRPVRVITDAIVAQLEADEQA